MAFIAPFHALRPTPASAPRVAAVPYDVVNTQEAHALANGNPLSFLHVSRAEIDLPPNTDPHSDSVYRKAVENFAALKTQAPLVDEEAPSLYVYRLQMGRHIQTGIAGTFSIDEHEHTRRDKEDDRTRHMVELRAQTGPVFLTYRAASGVDRIVAHASGQQPLFDFTAPDGVQHTIWRADGADVKNLVAAFDAIPLLYIADGHHRTASAVRYAQACRARNPRPTGNEPYESFMAVVFPHNQLKILDYNRLIKDLNGLTPEQFLAKVAEKFEVSPNGSRQPTLPASFGMYLEGKWYTLQASPGSYPADDPIKRLDVSILQDNLLSPVLGIRDPRTDTRIDFVGGIRGMDELERRVREGFAVAFSMYPTSLDQLIAVADAGQVMPPKSTWFEPKLRSGLLVRLYE